MTAIPGTVGVTGIVAPKDSADTYAVGDTQYIKGAPLQLADLATLEAWAYPARLTIGQLGYATDTAKYYKLTVIGPPNTWVEIAPGGDLWSETSGKLNTVNADDVALNIDKAYEFKQPTNSTFYATFSATIDADYSLGSATGTASGGAAIATGKLDLAHTDNRYVSYVATSNADSQQVGAFKFKIIPNYSGSPAAVKPIFSVASALSANLNEISLWHAADGTIRLNISNSAGSPIISNYSFGSWGQTALTEYEFELDFDITTGATRLFINGTQKGSTDTNTGTRSSSIGILSVGQLVPNPTFLSNIYIKDFIVFNAVQHTANYTPGYTLQNIKLSKEYSAAKKLQVFDDLTLTKLAIANGVLQTDTNGKASSSTALPNGTTATTQSAGDNTTKLATDAFVQAAVGAMSDIFAGKKSLYVRQFGSDKAEIYYPTGTTGTGFINVAADFPAGWGGVTQGDCYTVPNGVTVTDNDPTKTNTGQTFVGPVQIAADKTNTRWLERDGLTVETCVSSVTTALYLSTITSTYPDYYPILVLDAATYTFGAGDAIYASITAPFAKFVSLGTILQYAKKVVVDTLIMDVGSYVSQISGDNITEFNCRYAAFGATPSVVGIFANTGAPSFVLKAGVVNGGSSTVQTIAAQARAIYAEIGKFTGKAIVTSGGGAIDITTTDRATLTTDATLGHVQVTINTADLTTVNASITSANTRITSVQQDVGQLPSGGDQLYFGNSIIQSVGSENENYLINAYTYAPGNSEGTATITVSSGVSPLLYAAFLVDSDTSWMAGIGRGITAAKIWASTNTSSGTTTLAFNVRVKKSYAGTVTITGTGTTRTVDSTVDAFDDNDPNAGAKKLASYLETPKGRYQIITKTTTKQVYITVPSGYVNESAVAFSKYKYLYELYSEALPYVTVSPLVSFSAAKAEFSPSNDWAWGDKLAVFVFAATTVSSSITITWKFDGATNYSCIQFPKFLRVKTVTDQILLTSDDSNIPNIALDATSGSADADLNWRVPMDSALVVGADIPYWVGAGATGATQDIDLTTYYGVGNASAINQYTHADTASTYNIAAASVNYRISFLSLIPEAVADTRGSVNLEANTLGGYIHLGAPIITYIEK